GHSLDESCQHFLGVRLRTHAGHRVFTKTSPTTSVWKPVGRCLPVMPLGGRWSREVYAGSSSSRRPAVSPWVVSREFGALSRLREMIPMLRYLHRAQTHRGSYADGRTQQGIRARRKP